MDLLFELATWHGLAKLHLHTESTLRALESSTTRLGIALRKFQLTTCAEFVTRNLLSEEAARGCRKAAKAKLQPTSGRPATMQQSKSKEKVPKLKGKEKVSSTLRAFGLSNYKTHALADYPKMIREFGTTDGYSTQNVSFLFEIKIRVEANFHAQGELEHRRCKRFYPRVHKEMFAPGIAREVHRERILQFKSKNHHLVVKRPSHKKQKQFLRNPFSIAFSDSERLPCANPDQRYQMSNETRHPHDISRMIGEHYGDPALEVRTVLFSKIE